VPRKRQALWGALPAYIVQHFPYILSGKVEYFFPANHGCIEFLGIFHAFAAERGFKAAEVARRHLKPVARVLGKDKKRTAFWVKTQYVLNGNTARFSGKRTVFFIID
jgi:hypothetical protein